MTRIAIVCAVVLACTTDMTTVYSVANRIEVIDQEQRSTEPAPIEGAALIAPWEQTRTICKARERRAADDSIERTASRIREVAATSGAFYIDQNIEREKQLGRADLAEAMWNEWQLCLAELGWKLVQKASEPVEVDGL